MPRPFVVGVADLRRRPGTRREVEVAGELPGLSVSASRVPEGAVITARLTLESLSDGLTATGTVTVPWVGECRRCLEDLRGSSVADVREVFEPDPVEGETYPIRGDDVDLEPMVRDAALLALPLAPLCAEDCSGPAPEAFPTGPATDDAPAGSPGVPDPRWSALEALRLDRDDD